MKKLRAYLALTFTLIGLALLIAVASDLLNHSPARMARGTVATWAPRRRNALASPPRPSCTHVSPDCGDVTPWQRWPDADPAAGVEVLDCERVHRRANGAPAYEMDGPHGLASHNEIAAWFRLGRAGQLAFMFDCNL